MRSRQGQRGLEARYAASGGAPRFVDFARDPVTVARRLLGQRLVRVLNGERIAGRIVETEAYLGEADRAAHTFNGRRTQRNESMYLAGGHAYIYFTYGMHYCFNVVCGEAGDGVAALIRALEPEEGIETMFMHRFGKREAPGSRQADLTPPAGNHRKLRELCSGPAKLAQALALDRSLDGVDLRTSPVLFIERVRERCVASGRIGVTPRIGVPYAGACAERPLRFFVAGNPHVSA